jgi:hypothetical protein
VRLGKCVDEHHTCFPCFELEVVERVIRRILDLYEFRLDYIASFTDISEGFVERYLDLTLEFRGQVLELAEVCIPFIESRFQLLTVNFSCFHESSPSKIELTLIMDERINVG